MRAQMFNAAYWVGETDPETLHNHFTAALPACGFTVLSYTDHLFDPMGYTSLYLLSESHLAIHTFPEHGLSYIEISSCILAPFERITASIVDCFELLDPTEGGAADGGQAE